MSYAAMNFNWSGWSTTNKDNHKLTHLIEVAIVSHPNKPKRCLMLVFGPLLIGIRWFNQTVSEEGI